MTTADRTAQPGGQRGAMSAAELRVIRERLGLTPEWCAHALGVAERSFTRWEAGANSVPDGVAETVHGWQEAADRAVEDAITDLDRQAEPVMLTYRTNAGYHAATGEKWPASYHRAIAGRVAEGIDDLAIDYADE